MTVWLSFHRRKGKTPVSKFRVSGPKGADGLMVKANRPGRAAQKYADGFALPPGGTIQVENHAGRVWHYRVGEHHSVTRISSPQQED